MNGNFRVIRVVFVAGLGEAICLPVASPVRIAVHRHGDGQVTWIREVIWESGVDDTGVSDVQSVSGPKVVAMVSMDDKVAVRWTVWRWGFLCNLFKWEVLQNQQAVWTLVDLNRGIKQVGVG